MNSQLITYPDFVKTSNTPLLLINVDPLVLKLIVTTCESLDHNFDIFVSGNEVDPEWFNQVVAYVDKIFKNPTFDDVYQYIKGLNEGS